MPTIVYSDLIHKKDLIGKNRIKGEDDFFYTTDCGLVKEEGVEEGVEAEMKIEIVEKECYEQYDEMTKKLLTGCIKKMMKTAAEDKKSKGLAGDDLKAWQKKTQDFFLDIINNHFDEYTYFVKDSAEIPDGCYVILAKWADTGDKLHFFYYKDCLYEQKF